MMIMNGPFRLIIQRQSRFTQYCWHTLSLPINGLKLRQLSKCLYVNSVVNKKYLYQNQSSPIYIHEKKWISSKPQQNGKFFTIPNLLSGFRIGSAPVISYLILTNQMHFCFYLAAAAGITDLLDGWIAKTFPSQRSAFGSFLDPVADKVLVAFLSCSLAYTDLLPVWLVALFISRDLALLIGGVVTRYKSVSQPRSLSKFFDATDFSIKVEPLLISKINTFLQLALIALTIGAPIWDYTNSIYLQYLWYSTAITTVTSGFGYLFSKTTFQQSRKS